MQSLLEFTYIARGTDLPWLLSHTVTLKETAVGSVCFSTNPKNINRIIRGYFQKDIVTTSCVITYWNSIVENISWQKVWSLTKSDKSYINWFTDLFLLTCFFRSIKKIMIHSGITHQKCCNIFWTYSLMKTFWLWMLNFIHTHFIPHFTCCFKNVIFGSFICSYRAETNSLLSIYYFY